MRQDDYQPLTASAPAASLNDLRDTVMRPYVCTKPYAQTLGWLVGFQNRIDLPGKSQFTDLHSTIMFSTTEIPVQLARVALRPTLKYTARALGLQIFGPNNDVLVLELECKEATARHEFWKSIGCKPSFPEYKMHVTLFNSPHESDASTNADDWLPIMERIKADMEPRVKKLPPLEFAGEWLEPIREKGK